MSQVAASRGFLLSCINYNQAEQLCRQPVQHELLTQLKLLSIKEKEEGKYVQQHKTWFDILKLVQEALPWEAIW